MRTIEDDVRRFVIDNFLYGKEVPFNDESSFLDLGIIDSTGLLELIAFLEKKYRIAIEDADLIPDNLDSILLLANFVRRKLGREPEPVAVGDPTLNRQMA